MATLGVLGATSWGITLASLLERNSHRVVVLVRSAEEAESVGAVRGIARLPEVRLSVSARVLHAAEPVAIEGLIVAVPSQSLRTTVEAGTIARDVPVLSAAKGLERGTNLRMTEVLAECGWAPALTAAISGPNLAHEIAKGLPAAAVVASESTEISSFWQGALAGPMFRVYTSEDTVGVELAGALKNVIAIAAGAAHGLNFGDNTVAAIMTRGLAEMTRLGVALGADPLTFQGLAGVGDLAATCFSKLSRNSRFGSHLASGLSASEALVAIGESVEGADTAPVAVSLGARHSVELPIAAQVAAVVAGERTVAEAMAQLLTRRLTGEAGSRL
jgi:glycerol-3-phosphate dehydrogenase (NAD(P)+)